MSISISKAIGDGAETRSRAKPVAHLMQYHLLQWEVAKLKQLMTSNMTLTVLNLHQKTPKGATTKIQVKRYKRDK